MELYHRIYINLSDEDSICIDEVIPSIKGNHSSLDKAKSCIRKNAAKIREVKFGDVVVESVSIVEVLEKDGDIETEVTKIYPIDKLEEIK